MDSPNQNKRKAQTTLDSPQSKKRHVILVGTKLEIIQGHKNGVSTSDLARKYNLSASTISTIINPANQEKLIGLVAKSKVLETTKTLKLAQYMDIDRAVDRSRLLLNLRSVLILVYLIFLNLKTIYFIPRVIFLQLSSVYFLSKEISFTMLLLSKQLLLIFLKPIKIKLVFSCYFDSFFTFYM